LAQHLIFQKNHSEVFYFLSDRPVIAKNNGTYIGEEGQSLTLPCNVQGNPTPNITWFKNVQPVNMSDDDIIHGG